MVVRVKCGQKGPGHYAPGPFLRYNDGMSLDTAAVSIFIFSPYHLQRSAWTALLSQQPELNVRGAVGMAADLVGMAADLAGMAADLAGMAADLAGMTADLAGHGPAAVLVDVALPEPKEVAELKQHSAGKGLLLLVDTYEADQVVSLLQAGAIGIMVRDSRVADLVSALTAVARGEMVLPADVALQAISRLAHGRQAPDSAVESLSVREKEVVSLLAQGLTNKDIAQTLFLSVRTIEAHLRSIYGKLEVSSRTEAALWAVKSGFGAEIR
jgi:DNA-binding NarL/FixJ family response regulator